MTPYQIITEIISGKGVYITSENEARGFMRVLPNLNFKIIDDVPKSHPTVFGYLMNRQFAKTRVGRKALYAVALLTENGFYEFYQKKIGESYFKPHIIMRDIANMEDIGGDLVDIYSFTMINLPGIVSLLLATIIGLMYDSISEWMNHRNRQPFVVEKLTQSSYQAIIFVVREF